MGILLLPFLPACASQDSGPPLIVQRDSAGIQIVEALRPLWGDSSLWSIDPDPIVDLTLSGSGPSHEFFRSGSMKQRPDGSLVVADRSSREVRLFSETGEFPSVGEETVPENSETWDGSRTPATLCWLSAPDASPRSPPT